MNSNCLHYFVFQQITALYFRSIEMEFNPKYVASLFSNISTDRSTMNLALNQIKSAPVDYWMKVSVSYKQQASKKYLSLLSFNVNLCDLFRNELNQQGLVHLWMSNMLKYSNMPRTCPWKAVSSV